MTNLLINEYPLMVLPSLANKIGLNEAIILQQIHYWLDPRINKNFHEECFWVYNTYKMWQIQFPFWSEITVKRTIQSLEKQNLIISKYRDRFNKIKWYTINYQILKNDELKSVKNSLISSSDQNDPMKKSIRSDSQIKMIRSINKNTETTTETNNSLSKKINKCKQKDLVREMLDIWNDKIQEGKSNIHITSSRRMILKNILYKYLDNDLNNWQNLCQDITTSDFLMGKVTKFKASIDWVLNEKIIIKILEGDYGISNNHKIPNNNKIQDISLEIDALSESQEAKLLRKAIVKKIGKAAYASWFSKIVIQLIDKSIHFKAPSRFNVTYVLDNYLVIIKQTSSALFSEEREVIIYA